jgi:hypothetical protein
MDLPDVDLPKPRRWRNGTAVLVFAILLFGTTGIAALVIAVKAIAVGDLLTTAVVLGSAVFCMCASLIGIRILFMKPTLRASFDGDGTTLRADLPSLVLGFVALGAAIPTGILYCIYVPQGRVDIPLSAGDRVFSPYLIALLVLIALWGFVSLATRREAGHFTLSTDGYEIVTLGVRAVRGAWDAVVDIGSVHKKTRRPIVFVLRDGRADVLRNASGFAPNGAAVYWMVRHYWLQPEDRSELTDGRALERLKAQRFEVN